MSALYDIDFAIYLAEVASTGNAMNMKRIARAEAASAAVRLLVGRVDAALALGWSDAAERDLREAIKPFRQEVGK